MVRVELGHPIRPIPLLTGVPIALLVFPLVTCLQGLQPHLGYKAVQSFAMFSNLDTQVGQSNHFFIPSAIQISDNLSDTVVIHSTNLPKLSEAADFVVGKGELSYAYLRQIVSRRSNAGVENIRVDYTHRGVRKASRLGA